MVSGTTYPVRGIFFFSTHPSLWVRVFCGLLIALAFSITATVLLFALALKPQALGLAERIPAWLAWIIAVICVLLEIFVSSLLFVAICLPVMSDQLFDDVMALATGQPVPQTSCWGQCKGVLAAGFWLAYLIIARVLLLVITAPLNLVPIAGTVLFLFINGYLAAWNQHLHWFELRGVGFTTGKQFVRQHRSAYMNAGAVMVLLEMIPGIGILFMFTNIVGAALWAAELESKGIGPGQLIVAPGAGALVPHV
ncbi:hypothetical protein PhCBS80983_g03042 [Powellomyces hirtus]|uniref:Uncharacterized protein n=1 Tax=Powellomyces hirtus TaxID=109895 RepID=A0A507E4E3_9FUNG|nr:hypothetical protein PhCBS80983_g03042 [Powellomyces hirtus]